MKMVVGLGNPGTNYQENRHNLGFMAIDHFVEVHHLSGFKEQKGALTLKGCLSLPHSVGRTGETTPRDLLLVKPLTYMNLSGNAVQQLMSFYKITTPDLLVITEDVHLPFGTIKIRSQGGTGGHNGLKSIHKHLGEKYTRLRFGVDWDDRIPMDQYVLSDFPRGEREVLPEHLGVIANAVADFVGGLPLDKLMSEYNGGGS